VKLEMMRLKKLARLAQGKKEVLDLGCAAAPNPFLTNGRVVGMDLNRGKVSENYHDFIQGDVMKLPEPFAPNSFDAVIAGELIEHLERPVDFLRACHRSLKNKGLIVLSTPNPNSPMERLLTIPLSQKYYYTPNHICLYPQRWLMRMLHIAGFSEIKLYSGGIPLIILDYLLPFPRPWAHYTIATGVQRK
jgi:2-polyprenyl-3-methyl-5-hydroxy-6-metoxy-1,4-benzoquinol methylase